MLDVHDLVQHYRTRSGVVRAVDGVTFSVAHGETLGVVGESGCGKSTMARLLVRLEQATSGRILVAGDDVTRLRGNALQQLRRRVQLVFQYPHSALNPRLTVGSTLGEVVQIHAKEHKRASTRARVAELLDMVGLSTTAADRYPHQLSGGQLQRVGIARALAVEPQILVLDEPVSALDVSVRAEIMNLLTRLRTDLGLTYIFISHDLGIIRHISDRIAVMYLGRIVELGNWQTVSDAPQHPYTQSLQQAVPIADPTFEATRDIDPLRGEAPDAAAPPPGCPFHPRCPHAENACARTEQTLTEISPGHLVSCHVVERGRLTAGSAPPHG